VVLGAPNTVAMYSPITGRWMTSSVGMYAHSVAIDAEGNAWANGHFTKDPVRVTRVTPTGEMTSFDLPRHPVLSSAPGGPIPYEIRVAPNGIVWMSELAGNRIVRLDPATRETRAYELPMTHGGPRRFDVAADGMLWIPAYAANELLRFDPASGQFTRHPLPIADALPYVARVDRRGRVWIGSGAADAVFLFDPATSRFTTFPLPSRGAMIRHMALDPRNGDVWLAYGASPALHPARIARLRARD
jgi:virginiamycin B lyase